MDDYEQFFSLLKKAVIDHLSFPSNSQEMNRLSNCVDNHMTLEWNV